MGKIAILAVFAAWSIGCGRAEPYEPDRGVDLQLQEIMADFYAAADAYGLTSGYKIWSAKVGPIENEEWIGVCDRLTVAYTDNGGFTKDWTTYRMITIVPDLDPLYLKVVFAHEMGHCAYNLPHVDDPTALMHPYIPEIRDEYGLRVLITKMFDSVSKRFHKN